MEKGEYTLNQSKATDRKVYLTEAAWDILQKQVMIEPVNAQWVRWSKQVNEASNEIINKNHVNLGAVEINITPTVTTPSLPTFSKAAQKDGSIR
jgi:hypothetical protein